MVQLGLAFVLTTACFPPIPEPADDTTASKGCGLSGSVLYVDATATQVGTGSEAAPFQTFQEALAALSPGLSVCLREGTYDGEFLIDKSGEKDAPIVIAGYPGEDVVIREPPDETVGQVLVVAGDYVTLRNLIVEGGGGTTTGGTVLVSSAIGTILSRVHARYGRGIAFNIFQATDAILEDCLAHDHVDPNDASRGKGFVVRGTSVVVRNSVAHNNFNRGYDVSDGALAENCAAFGTGRAFDNKSGKTIVAASDGIGFYTGDGGQIVRSVSFDNESTGFRSFDAVSGGWDHCTALRSNFSYGMPTAGAQFKIRNSLILEASTNLPDPADLPQVNNSWQLGIGSDVVLSTEPPQPSELWPATGSPWDAFENSDFLKPKAGSAIVDAGAVLDDRPFEYAGSAPDLGAFELAQ